MDDHRFTSKEGVTGAFLPPLCYEDMYSMHRSDNRIHVRIHLYVISDHLLQMNGCSRFNIKADFRV